MTFLEVFKDICYNFFSKKKIKVLVRGSGAKEHSIAWKILQSSCLEKLYLNSSGESFKNLGEEIKSDGIQLIKDAKAKGIDLIINDDEGAQAKGFYDIAKQHGINCVSVSKKWAQLENSKKFAKDFMIKHSIATPKFKVIESLSEFDDCLTEFSFPLVLKPDGLTAGVGVVIVNNIDEAKKELNALFSGKFSINSKVVLVEEFIKGEELSLMTLWDGKTLLPLIPIRDYKKLEEGNKGPNTGGMGAYCPVNLTVFQNNQLLAYIQQLKNVLIKERADFTGILYSGLCFTSEGLKILEYNTRFGSPEAQALLTHMNSDFLELLYLLSEKKLHKAKLEWKSAISAAVFLTIKDYPTVFEANYKLSNIDKDKYGVDIFFNRTFEKDNNIYTQDARVLCVCKNSKNPYPDIYKTLDDIKLEGKFYRRDIGS